jgi:hypothetical protein
MKILFLGALAACVLAGFCILIRFYIALKLTQVQFFGLVFILLIGAGLAYFAKMIWDEI